MTRLACEVWLAGLDLARPTHAELLDEVELGRRGRFLHEVDRQRFTTAAALLRLVVAASTGIPPSTVHIDRTCATCGAPHGKPRAPGTGLYVSVSHAGGLVAVALTRSGPVGLDVEQITGRDTHELARLCLAPAEPLIRAADFFRYWCRKESVLKATGDGLNVPMTEVVVSPADAAPRLVSYQGVPMAATMADLPPRDGYAGAVTILATGELDLTLPDPAALLG